MDKRIQKVESTEDRCCHLCKYFRIDEEYWHDHYHIPEHQYCVRYGLYEKWEVDSMDCCPNFTPQETA